MRDAWVKGSAGERLLICFICLLFAAFWLFCLVPTYPLFGILCVWISRQFNGGTPGYVEFAKDWFTFRIIPFGDEL